MASTRIADPSGSWTLASLAVSPHNSGQFAIGSQTLAQGTPQETTRLVKVVAQLLYGRHDHPQWLHRSHRLTVLTAEGQPNGSAEAPPRFVNH